MARQASKSGGQGVKDCKSVYDHITGGSSPSTVGDRRVAVDMVIVREGLSRSSTTLRWAPTDRQLADALTKDSAEPCDLLRGVIRAGYYQISEESLMLDLAKAERQKRKNASGTVEVCWVGVLSN